MWKITGLVIFNVLLLAAARPKEVEDELLSVAVVFRHGDRTIISSYPNDPYQNRSYWPVGFGQLTNSGKQRQYALGNWLRKRYSHFLPELYSEEDIYIRSTDVDRVLMSAYSNLAGLYPPKGIQVWNQTIPWQPIPVHTMPQQMDNVLGMKKPCPKYDKMYQEFLKSKLVQNMIEENQETFDYCTKHSGKNFTLFTDFENLHGVLDVEKTYFNFTLPEWTDSIFPNKTEPLSGISFGLPSFNNELARFKGGIFFYELIEYFKSISSGKKVPKFRIFSAHDTTLSNYLQSLDNFDFLPPPYAAMLIFELRNAEDPYVNIFYRKFEELRKISLPECSFNCKLTEFERILKPVIISKEQWEIECAKF